MNGIPWVTIPSMVACLCRVRTSLFLVLITIIFLSYVAYNIYLLVLTRIERKEICEKLNSIYKGKTCLDPSLKINSKRAILQELLREWIKLAIRNNISYVLSSGSLLGQYRNKDIIPWDTDVDVMVKDSSLSKLVAISTPRNFIQGSDSKFHFVVQPEYMVKTSKMKRWNCNNQIVNGQPDHCSFIGPIARLIKDFDFVDIFGLEVEGEYAYESYEKKYFRVDALFPGKDCFFMEIKTKCPKNVKEVLEIFFHSIQEPCNCIDGRWIVTSWWDY